MNERVKYKKYDYDCGDEIMVEWFQYVSFVVLSVALASMFMAYRKNKEWQWIFFGFFFFFLSSFIILLQELVMWDGMVLLEHLSRIIASGLFLYAIYNYNKGWI
ncbi:MAG: hypothetical protein ABID38_02530 [Candidatus Diapherotrites archaeon]